MLLVMILFAVGLLWGCSVSGSKASDGKAGQTQELTVFVTNNAEQVREKALSYGLPVKTIDSNSPASQLIQALLNSPSDEYFAVINPVQNRYIAGGAVSNLVNSAEIDNLFRKLKLISKAGAEEYDRLLPSKPGHVRLAIFSDFQCPYCKVMDGQASQWASQFGDRLEVEMLHFPLPMHQYAFAAAEASECARVQGKFEPFKTALFENQKYLNEGTIYQISRNLKLDQKRFSQCMNLHEQRKKVRQEQYLGQYLGLAGTPTVMLNGEPLMGIPAEEVPEKIKAALAKAEKELASQHSGSAESPHRD